MTIELDHVIVPSRRRRESAKLLADLLAVPWEETRGEFTPVYVNESLTLDFADRDQFERYHLCFRVSDADFEAIFARIQRAGLAYRSRPRGENEMQINRRLGGKNVYWQDGDSHLWEMLTVSYARADSPPLAASPASLRRAPLQRGVPEPQSELPVCRDPAPDEGVHRRPSRRAPDRSRGRRRDAALAARGRAGHARGHRRDGPPRDLQGLRPVRRLRVPAYRHRHPRLWIAWCQDRRRRGVRERRRQERQCESAGDLRSGLRGSGDGSGLPRVRRQ